MKIILQPEARTISNFELVRNQQDLIALVNKLRHFNFRLLDKATKAKSSP